MKNYIFIAIAVFFLGCQKENTAIPEITSTGVGSNHELVLSEAYDGANLVQRNTFENGRLIRRQSPNQLYRYDDINNRVIETQGEQVRTYQYTDDGQLSYMIFSIRGRDLYRRDFIFEKDRVVRVSTYNIIPNSFYVYDLLYDYENPWISKNSIVYKTEINGVPVPQDTVVMGFSEWHSPYELTEYNEQHLVTAVRTYSNTIKNPTYNLRIIPNLNMISMQVSKNDLMSSNDIWGAGVPKLLMLSEEIFFNGQLDHRMNVENIVLNKEGLPYQYDAVTYSPQYGTTRVTKKFKYITL
jgi:hypothetical protein